MKGPSKLDQLRALSATRNERPTAAQSRSPELGKVLRQPDAAPKVPKPEAPPVGKVSPLDAADKGPDVEGPDYSAWFAGPLVVKPAARDRKAYMRDYMKRRYWEKKGK